MSLMGRFRVVVVALLACGGCEVPRDYEQECASSCAKLHGCGLDEMAERLGCASRCDRIHYDECPQCLSASNVSCEDIANDHACGTVCAALYQ